MSSILYTAYQKFYSALSALEQFDKEEDFFDNISNLDKFLSEFRTVTLVLQKAIAHTEYKDLYDKNNKKYLSECKWFITKRNEVTKEQPFQLVKQIEISIYLPFCGMDVLTKTFTVENDVEFSTLLNELKTFLCNDQTNEVFFSAKFSFYEKDTNEDLYDKLMIGIKAMKDFLGAMRQDIGEQCQLCDALSKKITEMHFLLLPRDILFMIDYVYYPCSDEFEQAGRMAMMFGAGGQMPRIPLSNLDHGMFSQVGHNYFEKFIIMNTVIKTADLMPTIWIIYNDNTFTMDVFHSNIKTTIYRKMNETADNILKSDVKEVYCMMTYTLCDIETVATEMTSTERVLHGTEDYLTFIRVDKELNAEEYSFEGSKLEDLEYVCNQFQNGKKNKLDLGRLNLTPVIEGFKKKKLC